MNYHLKKEKRAVLSLEAVGEVLKFTKAGFSSHKVLIQSVTSLPLLNPMGVSL